MTEMLILGAALFAGTLLGAFYFGGLWWTIRVGISSEWSALLFSSSFLLRTVIALAGFYFISHGEWRRLLSCLAGFLFARILITRMTRLPAKKRPLMIQEGGR